VIEFELGARSNKFEGADHGSSISCFIINYTAPGMGPKLHRHPYEETFVVLAGEATFTIDGETIEARAGQILVVPANTPHKFVSTGDEVLRIVSVHPRERMSQEDLEQ
jgi:mannose-6-phosphate isomerase-like protein (cupin superfamily)